jgi:2-oxoglutarate dehydrogenase E2 component (dihydrolipoamide succinyltransferase)
MAIEIKVPSPGESISEVEIARWFVNDGEYVIKDQEIGEIESEKATLPLIAESAGTIKLLGEAGTTVAVGTVVATIDADAQAPATDPSPKKVTEHEPAREKPSEKQPEAEILKPTSKKVSEDDEKIKVSPLAKKMMEEKGLSVHEVINGLRRLSVRDVENYLSSDTKGLAPVSENAAFSRDVARNKLSNLRKKLSERLVAVKNETAMLTTFNEADMSQVMKLRKTWQEQFVKTHGVKLGFMSLFTMAVSRALKEFPNVNSRIEQDELVIPSYCDIGIAVQTDKGLMVPIIRNAESMGLAEIEKSILELAEKARKNRLSLEEMSGGTFTITNGGVFGSMMSTPILNPPQSAILGMHNIIERPVAVEGQVLIRPMMYLALSYDHRVIDGRDSVGFLVKVKEYIENPERMLFGGKSPEKTLLGLS